MRILTPNNYSSHIKARYRGIQLSTGPMPQKVSYQGKTWTPIVSLQGHLNKKTEKALRIKLIVLAIFTLGILCCTKKFKEQSKILRTKKENIIIAAVKDNPFLRKALMNTLGIKTETTIAQVEPPSLNSIPKEVKKFIGEFLLPQDLAHLTRVNKENGDVFTSVLKEYRVGYEILTLLPLRHFKDMEYPIVSPNLFQLTEDERIERLKTLISSIQSKTIDRVYYFREKASINLRSLFSYLVLNYLRRDWYIENRDTWYPLIAELLLKKNPHLEMDSSAWGFPNIELNALKRKESSLQLIQATKDNPISKNALIELILKYQPELDEKLKN